jgi:hypothetical protein
MNDIMPYYTGKSVIKPLYESDADLVACLAIMDAFPLGELGYLIAESRAERNGTIDDFHQKINKMANDIAQKIDEFS